MFPGPFRLAQARAVCADDTLPAAAIGPALARLVEQSLVQAVAGRFHLLETLRTYAARRLSEPARLRLRAWHAAPPWPWRLVADHLWRCSRSSSG